MEQAEKEWKFIEQHDVHVLPYWDNDFPKPLASIPDAPALMFFQGDLAFFSKPCLAVIGTRKPSQHGLQWTRDLVEGLSDSGFTIVSGLAYGIDITAHKAALTHRVPTLAVLGSGLGTIYPFMHSKIAHTMVQRGGGLLTEYLHNDLPEKGHFPERNRLVAGLCMGIIVVESDIKGGSIITARLAFDYDREVMVVPGIPNSRHSMGCHALIRENQAHLVEHVHHVLDIVKPQHWGYPVADTATSTFETLSVAAIKALKEIPTSTVGRIHRDVLLMRTELNHLELSSALLELELNGLVSCKPGNYYVALSVDNRK